MSVLGIDLGTSGVRVVAYGSDGRELAAEADRLTLRRPAPGRAELDAGELQDAVEAAIRRITGSGRLVADPVAALSFSVLGEAVAPVDGAGSPLAPAIVSMDERGASALARFAMPGAEYQAITGQPLHPMFSAFKIAAEGGPWRTAVRYLCLGDYLTLQWTGEAVIDYGMAARTGLFDVGRLAWSDDILARFQEFAPWLDEAKLPRVGPSGQAVGALLPTVAARLGLPATTVVALGTHDQAAALLGCGGAPGLRCCLSFGSSDCLTVATASRPHGFEQTGLASYPIDDATWVTLAGTAAGGWALDWFARLTGRDSVGEAFDELSPEPPPLLVVPYLRGSGTLDNDPAATGTVHGITLDTTVPQLARAFVEASGLEFARIADAFASRGVQLGEIAVSGGGAANLPALTARANALGRPLSIGPDNAAARGAARLAARSIGLPEPVAPSGEAASVRPEPELAGWYAAQRRNYLALVEATGRLRPPKLTEPNTQGEQE